MEREKKTGENTGANESSQTKKVPEEIHTAEDDKRARRAVRKNHQSATITTAIVIAKPRPSQKPQPSSHLDKEKHDEAIALESDRRFERLVQLRHAIRGRHNHEQKRQRREIDREPNALVQHGHARVPHKQVRLGIERARVRHAAVQRVRANHGGAQQQCERKDQSVDQRQ